MGTKIFYNKTVHENAAYYYDLSKEVKEKIIGLEKAIEETEKEIKEAKKGEKKQIRIKRTKEWYEKFHFSFTSGGRLMIGGRNAQQNDILVARHMTDNDLFFHADIQGASAVILLDGLNASESELAEVAQFAASFSKAWINGNASVDVYAVKRDQLSKHAHGGFIPTGAFAISGERRWFRATRLALRVGINEKRAVIIPDNSQVKLKDAFTLVPSRSGKDKGAIAKSFAKHFNLNPDDLLELLPNGKSKTIGY
jgi:predicted ribosome quality control (RQC) complex YloA/Tae2 family protein